MINEINIILSEKELDERVKPLIKLFFLGKLKLYALSIEQIKDQIDILCSRIANVEFSVSDKIVVAYESKAGVLTINKQLFLDGKSDEVILPVFMKFEEALNQDNRNDYGNHIEDFIRAGRIAESISLPISDRLYKLYEMAEYSYGDIEHKVHELIEDGAWKNVCSKYNTALNEMIVTGVDDQKALLDGVRLFHNEIFTNEALGNPDFEGPYKNEKYQKKASKILACIDIIKSKKYISDMDTRNKEYLIKNIKLFTGCTEEMVEIEKYQRYQGDSRISTMLESKLKGCSKEITEEFIVDRVQKIIDRKPEWDSRIKHLIIPFFIRSQKIYNWNIDELQERVNELDLRIDKIVFENLESLTIMGNTAGNLIKLNSRIFLDKKRRISMACN